MKTDLYQHVTDQIVANLEQGVRPWMKPWSAEHAAGRITRPLRANGIAYQGINVLVLWSELVDQGLQRPDLDDVPAGAGIERACAQRRARQHGRLCQHRHPHRHGRARPARRLSRRSRSSNPIPCSMSSRSKDCRAHFHAIAQPRLDPVQRIERAESFFAATRADIRHGGNMAYYNIDSDFVQMPPFEAFRDAESYYASLAHECTHWTRHKSRLDRDLGRKQLGRCRLRHGGTGGGAWQRLPLRRSRPDPGSNGRITPPISPTGCKC